MVRRPRAALALLVALVLTAASPAAIHASDAPSDVSIAATSLNTNLLHNGGFEATSTDGSIPAWTVEVACAWSDLGPGPGPTRPTGGSTPVGSGTWGAVGHPGLVRQSVSFSDWQDRTFWLKAHLQADFGGQTGHAIRVTIRVTGPGIDRVKQELKPLIITNSYKRAVAWLLIPPGTDRITATVELVGTGSGSGCRMVADTIKLIVFRV